MFNNILTYLLAAKYVWLRKTFYEEELLHQGTKFAYTVDKQAVSCNTH